MPEEVLALMIVLSFFTFIFTVIKSTQQYKLRKLEQQSAGSGDSLTTSELHELIDDAVAEATSPLKKQVEELRSRLASVERSGAPADLVDELDDEIESPVEEKTVGRQSRRERA